MPRGEEMLALVEDLLHVWRLESPALELVRTSVRPADLVEEVGDEWRAAIEVAGGQLLLEVAPSLPVVPVDAGVLRRVFGNLLHNAVQHAGRAATVHVGAKADGSHVVFHVSDTGVGIPGEFRDAIVRPFARVPRAEARAPRGTGLGLAFCRLAVLAHGGTIWVESEEGKGTTFRFRLPVEPANAAVGLG